MGRVSSNASNLSIALRQHRVPSTNVHPATKQLDGRMQPQTLPSSLTVRPVYMASSHTTKTLAMPSKSTLPYATKQLDDTLINSRTQPFTRQLNTSPPAKRLDGSTWFKSWQLKPKTPRTQSRSRAQRTRIRVTKTTCKVCRTESQHTEGMDYGLSSSRKGRAW